MKKNIRMLPGMIIILLAACFLLVGFSSHDSAKKEKSACCCKIMKNCAAKTNNSLSGDMILENFPRQFLFVNPLVY
jgi:hypothetical protein